MAQPRQRHARHEPQPEERRAIAPQGGELREAEASSSPRPVLYVALAANAAIAVAKFIAALITGSAAMLAEGIHSSVDIGNQLLLLYGLRRARRPPDEEFPFGYGKEVYFWSFVVAIQLFTIGAGEAVVRGLRICCTRARSSTCSRTTWCWRSRCCSRAAAGSSR